MGLACQYILETYVMWDWHAIVRTFVFRILCVLAVGTGPRRRLSQPAPAAGWGLGLAPTFGGDPRAPNQQRAGFECGLATLLVCKNVGSNLWIWTCDHVKIGLSKICAKRET